MSELLDTEHIDNLPESLIKPRSRFSVIWVIPIIALLIGAWLAYKAWSEMGPVITISFKTAEGLETGKTKIKYKNVEIGVVKAISLNHETKDVDVLAELNNESEPYLTDKTRFWVVKARIAAGGVQGLDTLLSGAYIGIDPIEDGNSSRTFTGLNTPPVVTSDAPGKHFVLHTDNLGSIERDLPIYYRKFNVGQVENVRLNNDGKTVIIEIFVKAPFDAWVNNTTKFWNVSGLDFAMNTNGIRIDTESVTSLLIGGIAFESASLDESTVTAKDMAKFKLYDNREATFAKDYSAAETFVLNFSDSVRGLAVGAPVEFKGIQIGEVLEIELTYNPDQSTIEIPVTVRFDLGQFSMKANRKNPEVSKQTRLERINYFVKQGARAQLKTGNLLTGQLYVDIDFFQHARHFNIDWQQKTPEYPTMPTEFTELTRDLKNMLKKVDTALSEARSLARNLNQTMVPELAKTLTETQSTLTMIKTNLNNNSPLQQNLQGTLLEFKQAARSIKRLTDYLERHPEALISGKEEDHD